MDRSNEIINFEFLKMRFLAKEGALKPTAEEFFDICFSATLLSKELGKDVLRETLDFFSKHVWEVAMSLDLEEVYLSTHATLAAAYA